MVPDRPVAGGAPRLSTRGLRLLTGLLGIGAVGLHAPPGVAGDLVLLAGLVAAAATVAFPASAAPWGVLLAAAGSALAPGAGLDAGLLGQAVLLLLFQVCSGLSAAVAQAETVELRGLLPSLYRAGAVLLAVLPAGYLAWAAPHVSPVAAGVAAAAGAVLLLGLAAPPAVSRGRWSRSSRS